MAKRWTGKQTDRWREKLRLAKLAAINGARRIAGEKPLPTDPHRLLDLELAKLGNGVVFKPMAPSRGKERRAKVAKARQARRRAFRKELRVSK